MAGFPRVTLGSILRNCIVAEIVYSKRAIRDLDELYWYILETLKSPSATLHTVDGIQGTIDTLANSPRIGVVLSAISDIVDSDYRVLVCGNYLAFYRIVEDIVYIDRILYGRWDYITALLPDVSEKESKCHLPSNQHEFHQKNRQAGGDGDLEQAAAAKGQYNRDEKARESGPDRRGFAEYGGECHHREGDIGHIIEKRANEGIRDFPAQERERENANQIGH